MTTTRKTPQIGDMTWAQTDTPAEQNVTIEVTAIEGENARGWFVWGYRTGRCASRRSTMFPRRYFIAKS